MNKKIICFELLILFICLITTIFLSDFIYKKYVDSFIYNNSYIINKVIDKKIEEKDIIEIINNIDFDNVSNEILYKYGYSNIENIKSIKTIKKNIYITNIFGFLFLFILITTFYNIYIIRNNRKLKKLDTYLNNILNDNYSLDIKDYNEGMFSNLKNDIYKVTVKLKEQNENLINDKKNLEELLSNISHQIKTPLTSMYVINDILLSDNLDNKKRKEFLNKNENQLIRIEWLVTSLLKLSRLESGMVKFDLKEIKIKDLIDKVIEPISINLELKNIEVNIIGDFNSKIKVDKNWMTEALLNIVKNAMEYTKDLIEIRIEDNPLYNIIDIKDNGSGIDSEDINHIFERFYKKNCNTESMGIGLNMSKKIIDMHSSTIEVINNNGTTFRIKIYKNII